jgi:pyruvate,water dikinase
MARAKMPVPPGFVVLKSAFDDMLARSLLREDITAQLNKINYNDINSVDRYSNVIRDIITATPLPKKLQQEIMSAFKKLRAGRVAVRSSATAEDSKTASFAGELETYLNTTEKTLISNIKKCWSSLYTPRALFYCHEKKLLAAPVSVAVVVQKMIASEVSGVAFTVHPVTEDKNEMIIEACFGLGEALVSGQVTPDSYIIDKRSLAITKTIISEQKKKLCELRGTGVFWRVIPKKEQNHQKLSNAIIKKLARLCVKIEKHYKAPQDIEWAYASGKLYILQSRPITTL